MKITAFLSTFIIALFMFNSNAISQYDTPEASGDDIVSLASQDDRFSTLATLLVESELAPVLTASDNLTVFAPTDEAFAQIPEEDLNALRNDPEMLQQVLLYHVVVAEVSSDEVVVMDEAQTALGVPINIEVNDYGVQINDATVTEADIQASNGVIHAIDAVLIPEAR